MTLSDKACEELGDAIIELVDLLPPNPLIARSVKIFKNNLVHAIKDSREKIEHDSLEPFHHWLHENNVKATEKKADSVRGALDELAKNKSD